MEVRTRFSPSPTGILHAGGARTALYNWLFAKKKNGKFILRIEDTDLKRSKKKYIKNIINSMKWLNINWDEGPFFQTERLNRYYIIIDSMLKSGSAYKCFCSEDRLKNLKKKQISLGIKPKYDRYCLNKSNFLNKNYTVRFFNNFKGLVSFKDEIRGLISFDNEQIDDLIICRSNGSPTYNFCVVIDDIDMNITHIIRGEEHINNTPRQINIFRAIGSKIPVYAHVSNILDDNGIKLSKRIKSTGIMQYREDGYLSETMINHLVRLGWSYGNKEIFSIEDIKKIFNIKNINKSSCFFNEKKLQWLNHFYINKLTDDSILNQIKWHIKKEKINIYTSNINLIDVINILKKHCKTLKKIAKLCKYFYEDIKEFNNNNIKKYLNFSTINQLKVFLDKIKKINDWKINNINNVFKEVSIDLNLKLIDVYSPIRIAITDYLYAPEIVNTIKILGKDCILKRIKYAIKFIYNKKIKNNN